MGWNPPIFAILLLLSLGEAFPGSGKVSYRGFKVIRTAPITNQKVVEALYALDAGPIDGVNFWAYPRLNASADIMSPPEGLPKLRSILNGLSLAHEIVIEDVEKLVQEENPRRTPKQSSRMNWDQYHRYNTIKDYCMSMSRSRADLVTTQVIGRSYEGKDIILTKISRGGGGNKPAIFVDGGMHAREWISPATTTYIMNKLITEANGKSSSLLDSFDWYFVPVINVDGYEYSHTQERLWRKTRSRRNGRCIGVDPNRNWGYGWATTGSSSDPCSDVYHGPRAFSEPETNAVAKTILSLKNIKMYITFHSYSQLWLIPYGHTDQKPADYNELYRVGNEGRRALTSRYNTQYKIGTAPDLLYKASGGSDDWAKGGAGIKYSYCLELRDTGRYGFMLPANQIKQTGEETFYGVKAAAEAVYRKLQKS